MGYAPRTRVSLTTSRENCGEFSPKKCQEVSPEDSSEQSWEGLLARSPSRLSRLFRDGDDDSSRPNIGGSAATRTSDREASRKWEQARRDGPADDALPRGSKQ